MSNIVVVGWEPNNCQANIKKMIRDALAVPGKGYEKRAVITELKNSSCVKADDLVTPAPYLVVRDTNLDRLIDVAHTLCRILNITVEYELIDGCLEV